MDRYFSKVVIFLSIFEGFIGFIIAVFFLDFKKALTASLLFLLLMLFINPLCLYITDRRYKDIELFIDENILLKENIYFMFYGRTRSGYLYLTDNIIYLHSRDRKPYLEAHIYRDEIDGIEVINDMILNIFIQGNYIYEIKSSNCRKITDALIKNGWINRINI